MAITHLEPVVPDDGQRPKVGTPDHPMRIVTRAVAFEPEGWTPERLSSVLATFDGLAAGWNTRFDPSEMDAPLADALRRGGPLGGRALEVGAGTGLATPPLVEHFDAVVSLDLSLEMLRQFPAGLVPRVQGDGGALPVRSASVDVVVLVNAFLFPVEVDRVLAPGGAVVWVNTLAEDTPIHLPVADVEAALPGRWDGVAAHAGWGLWGVFRRDGR